MKALIPPSCILVTLFLVVLPAAGADGQADAPHAAPVVAVHTDPEHPWRGDDVRVVVQLESNANAEAVTLLYCRAENYACAPPVRMDEIAESTFAAVIPWRSSFFGSATNVGYSITIQDDEGRAVSSPTESWPYRPESLPASAADYYFYALNGTPANLPGPSPILPLTVALAGAAWAGGRKV